MKRFCIVILFAILILCSFSFHKYYFAFAEIEYLKNDKKVEVTLIFTSHDLAQNLKKKGIINSEFEYVSHDSLQLKKIENEILKDFVLKNNSLNIAFELFDFEQKKNSLVNFYFSANDVELNDEIEFTFQNLMKDYSNQQNKLTFINGAKKQTLVFLNHKPSQKISI